MSGAAWAVAAGALPLAFLLRAPWFGLPLHIDTGFYVSNATIVHRRFRFSKGWNALLAGCSKALPEAFYSLVWLASGGRRYGPAFRAASAVWSWATALAVGAAAWTASGGSEPAFIAAVLLFTVASAEPQYGTYYECAEAFHGLFQAAAAFCLLRGEGPWIAAGLGLAVFDSLFVKLSSLPLAAAWGAAIVGRDPGLLRWAAGGAAVPALLFVVWLAAAGRSLPSLLRGLFGHEVYLSRKERLHTHVLRRVKKALFLLGQFLLGPVLPALALWGLLAEPPTVVVVWAAASLGILLLQSGMVWYYAQPLLPPLCLLAVLAPRPWPLAGAGAAALLLLLRTWLPRSRARAAWGIYGSVMVDHDLALEARADELRRRIGTRSLLVYGRWNQAYALLETAYETPLVAPAHWLAAMRPGWHRELEARFREAPPDFILDAEGVFDAPALEGACGLGYEEDFSFPPTFRLFSLKRRGAGGHGEASSLRDARTPLQQDVWGIPVLDLDVDGLARRLAEAAAGRGPAGAVLALNVHTFMETRRDPEYQALFERSPHVFCDGVPILWASRLLDRPLGARTHGHDLLEATLRASEGTGVGHYFLGGTEETLRDMEAAIRAKFPGARIAGTCSPPFRPLSDEEEAALVERVNASGAGILWVALGAPRQEHWIRRNAGRLEVPLAAGVGAAFEILAGRFSRAPRLLQHLGLEWAWRLAQDPGRLWKRYLTTNSAFLVRLAGTALRRLWTGL